MATHGGGIPHGPAGGRPPNHLAGETSPYLLQHAYNPVDWHPWGPEAFAMARDEDRPIFLSIGYSTCHWCHVMERESFEDEETARILNSRFVPIKVDREERPDVDQVYMTAVQAMTGQGGWPLSAWLTPGLEPFMGGTYFPPEDRHGLPGFKSVLLWLAGLWETRREGLRETGREMARALAQAARAGGPGDVRAGEALDRGALILERSFDPCHGGFLGAPKFPRPAALRFLLRRWRRSGSETTLAMVEKTLGGMARGGLFDQLGGGFHRYSTDARWLVPHFEKMLYDNALLAEAYIEAWQATKKGFYARIARETLDYLLRDMVTPEGAFCAAEDADSEGVEGKFYAWNPAQVEEALGAADGARFCRAFGVTPDGNWDPHEESIPKGQSVLHVAEEGDFEDLKRRLGETRARRVRPLRDDKVLTSWNALAIGALARAAQALEEPRYLGAAETAARFLLRAHRQDGRLLHVSRGGAAKIGGYLEDYAHLASAMLDLYEATFEEGWFEEARRLAAEAVDLFWDEDAGGFLVSGIAHESPLARMREDIEGAIPPGNAVMATTLLRLHSLTGEASYRDRAERTIRSFKAEIEANPAAGPSFLVAIDFLEGPVKEIVVAGPGPQALLRAVRRSFVPNKVVALAGGKAVPPLAEGRTAAGGKAAAYVCENGTCRRPVTEPSELEEEIRS